MWRSNFTIALGFGFKISAFTVQGKAIPSFVPKIIKAG